MKIKKSILLSNWAGLSLVLFCALSPGEGFAQQGAPRVSVACVQGGEVNMGNSQAFCKSALPTCDQVLFGKNATGGAAVGIPGTDDAGMIADIKNLLAWKIYGFYLGYDLDLNRSKFDQNSKNGLVGAKFNSSICSAAGHTLIQNAGTKKIKDAELAKQLIGNRQVCGSSPKLVRKDRFGMSAEYNVVFDNDNGGLWASQIMGAYPWVIRKNAHQVLSKLNAQALTNLNSILVNVGTSAAANGIMQQIKILNDNANKLTDQEKANCNMNSGELRNKCETLKFDDPAQRLCTLQKSRKLLYSGAVANLIALEIMARAEKDYQKYFGVLLSKNSDFKDYLNACGDIVDTAMDRPAKRKACAISCILGVTDEPPGADGESKNWMCIHDASRGSSPDKGICDSVSRKKSSCWIRGYNKIKNGIELGYVGEADATPTSGPGTVFRDSRRPSGGRDDSFSVNSGFAGFIEKQIRHYCGQSKISDQNDCDKVGIPSIPFGVKD